MHIINNNTCRVVYGYHNNGVAAVAHMDAKNDGIVAVANDGAAAEHYGTYLAAKFIN